MTYIALPALIRYGLPHALARYGVVSSVDGARVNLTNERVTLVGFQVGQAGGPEIRWGEITARVDMAELLKGNIRIIDFQVKEAQVDLAQLRASEWRPPARASAIPELRNLNIDIGNVVLRDLEFIDLSESVGQKIGLRSLSIGSLSHFGAGNRVAFQLEGAVGAASLRLVGSARMSQDLPIFEGRYELSALELDGFGHLFGLATPGAVSGRVDGNGTFELGYMQGEGVVRADLSGNTTLSDFELESSDASVTRSAAEWSGKARLLWPVAGGPPRITAAGRLTSPTLEAASRIYGSPVGILVRGLEWNGNVSGGSQLSIDGRFDGDLLRVDSSQEGLPRLQIELSRVSVESNYRSGGGEYEFDAEQVIAETAKLTQAHIHAQTSASAFQLSLHGVEFRNGRYAIGRMKAESAESMTFDSAGIKPVRSAQLTRLDGSGIEVRVDGGVRIENIEAARSRFDNDALFIDLGQARARNVASKLKTPLEVEELSAVSLMQRTGALETWVSEVKLINAGIAVSGEVFSSEAAAADLNQTQAGDLLWKANGIRAAALSIGARKIEAGTLSADRFAYGRSGGDLIEIDNGQGSNFSIQYDTGIDAQELNLGSMRYSSGQFTSIEFAAAEIKSPGVTFDGALSAKQFDAERARYIDMGTNVSVFDSLTLGEISGRVTSGLRIDAVHATRLSHDRATGADYDISGLEFSRVEFSSSGSASAIAGRVEAVGVDLADGARLTLKEVAAANPIRNGEGRIAADGGRVRELSYSAPGERVLNILNIEIGAIDVDDSENHRVASVEAARVEASDPGASTGLETGRLQIAAMSISAAGAIRAEQATADSVFLTGTGGDSSARFSSARINVNRTVLNSIQRLSFGEVFLDEAVLTIGLDDQGVFILPGVPFLSGNGKSSGSLVIDRLATKQSARLNFFDRSTTPPFEVAVSPLQAQLENFQSADPGRRAKFMLEGDSDEFSKLNASGEFSIEKDGLDLKIRGNVAAFDLNQLNAYAAKHAKRAIRSGHGDAVFDIAVKGRKLSGTIQFVFSKVVFEPESFSGAAEGQNPDELSLQHSFAMLKDKNGIVRLSVPLSGSLDDPKFNFSDGLVQALVKTVRSTVMLTFKPLGLLVSAAGLITGTEGLEFKPVAFRPGDHTLTGEGLAHLDALARQLEEHPGVEVHVCGRAVSADRIRIEQRRREAPDGTQRSSEQTSTEPDGVDALLDELADARASAVRSFLVEGKRITQERLIECNSMVETIPGRLPRVDLPVRVEDKPIPSSALPG